MTAKKLSYLVIGAGAVGGITAVLMRKAGQNVEIAVRDKEYESLISEKGIEISGYCGKHILTMPAYSSASALQDKKDVIILATKVNNMNEAARTYIHALSNNGYLISLQNGICEDELASIAGGNRIIGCVTGWGATMKTHGNLEMTSGGDFILGYPGRVSDDFLKAVANDMSSVVPVKTTDNIMGHKYAKLIINSCITSLGAICGLFLGKMLSERKIRKIFIEIIREAVAVSERMQIRLEKFAGKLDFAEFVKKEGIFADIRRHLLILAIGMKYRKLKSSSLQSLERGQLTEVGYLNGYIVRNGVALGVEVPVNKAIVSILKEIEAGKRDISSGNFSDPLFDRFN